MKVQWELFNVITLRHKETNNINQILIISKSTTQILDISNSFLGLDQTV